MQNKKEKLINKIIEKYNSTEAVDKIDLTKPADEVEVSFFKEFSREINNSEFKNNNVENKELQIDSELQDELEKID